MSGKGSGPRQGRYDRPLGDKTLSVQGFIDNRTSQEKYEDNWEAVFGKKKNEEPNCA